MKRTLAATGVLLFVVSGCAKPSTGGISAAAAQQLRPYVSALRVAAGGDSIAEVTVKEQALVQEVESLISSGDLSNAKGVKIENAASALLSDYRARNAPKPTPTPTESVTPTDTPTTPSPGPTVTITVPPPTDTATTEPTDTTTAKGKGPGNGQGGPGQGNGNGHGNGNALGHGKPKHHGS